MVLLIVQIDHLIGSLVIWDWYWKLVGMVRNQQHCEGCFFAFNEQVRGRSGEALVSAQILPIMWPRVWLFLSTTPLLQGDSAAVGCTIIPRWSATSKNSLLTNYHHCLCGISGGCHWQPSIYKKCVWWWFPCFYLGWMRQQIGGCINQSSGECFAHDIFWGPLQRFLGNGLP